MCEAVDFFRQALAEQGLEANVAHESDDVFDKFYVSKEIAGETITYSTNVSHSIQNADNNSAEKQIAMAARNVAQQFENHLTETFKWNKRCVDVLPYDEPEARCRNCGASVELPPRGSIFAQSAELSAPQPMPVEEQTVLESLDDHSRVLLKMYLMGKLREECDSYCPNSKYHSTERFI
jgi:hypothetical protein